MYLKENPEVAKRIENAIRGRTEVGEALMVGPGEEDVAAEWRGAIPTDAESH